MSYVLQLKGRLQELKMKQMEYETAIKAKLRAALDIIANWHKPLEDIDVEAAYIHLKEAREQKKQLKKILSEIKEIKRDLGEE